MIRTVQHMSLRQVEAFNPKFTLTQKCLVSIADPHSTLPSLLDGWGPRLFVCFDDGTGKQDFLRGSAYLALDETITLSIAGFVTGLVHARQHIEMIVNCDSGSGRSPAVAAAIFNTIPRVEWVNPVDTGNWDSAVFSKLCSSFTEFT